MLVRTDAAIDSPTQGDSGSDERFEQLRQQVDQLQLTNLRWGLLHQPVGAPPWVEGDVPKDDCADLLDRGRAIELEALLHWGNGIWTPSYYHYRLPSGEHAAGFVRVADAIQRPRDAEVLASWMHADLTDGVGIVVDTGTLSSVIQALLAAIRSKDGWRPGRVNVLDGYPATAFDVARALRETADGGGVLALLSVNSSGRVRAHLLEALQALPDTAPRRLDILVAKQEIRTHSFEKDGVVIRTWHPRPSAPPLVRYDAENGDVCELCRDTKTATLIPVSPRSFDGSLPAALATITPDVGDSRRNRRLWELCNADGQTISLDAEPRKEIDWRPPGRMAIVIDRERLLASPEFRAAAAASLEEQLNRNDCRPEPADLVLMPTHEFGYAGRDELIQAMATILGDGPEVRPFPLKGTWPDDLRKTIRQAKRCIAVVTLGTVTGTTLHSALAAVQSARDPGRRYDLYAYVLHARLAQRRAWETLENSFASSIFAAWHSYLPERSPLEDEMLTLQGFSRGTTEGLGEAAARFLAARLRFLSEPTASDELGLFWGSEPATTVTPNSIFGQNLKGPAVYVAVASAMERARKENRRRRAAPMRRVFEMPAVVRSYYDPMILAGVLRWLQPHEAWWGVEPAEEGQVVTAMLERATPEQLLILVPELLLAAAQGKLNGPGIQSVDAKAAALLEDDTHSDDQRAPIELGLALIPSAAAHVDDGDERMTSVED